jgi:hypothetical protein
MEEKTVVGVIREHREEGKKKTNRQNTSPVFRDRNFSGVTSKSGHFREREKPRHEPASLHFQSQ